MQKIPNKKNPFNLVIVFFFPIKLKIQSIKLETINNIKFWLNSLENSKGVIIAPTPKIKNKLRTQEPTKFPTAKSVSFLITAIIDVTSSGIAVPIATIVKPITLSDILKLSAISVALSTTKSPPYLSSTIPIIINRIESSTLIFGLFLLLLASWYAFLYLLFPWK